MLGSCRSVYTIYLFTLILGVLYRIKHSTITKLNTQNKEYEPYCFMEEERAQVIGGTLGLIISQLIYDFSPKLYVIGYILMGLTSPLGDPIWGSIMSANKVNKKVFGSSI